LQELWCKFFYFEQKNLTIFVFLVLAEKRRIPARA